MNIIGCDFHSRSQLIVMLDTQTGEVVETRLDHESGEARRFYEGLWSEAGQEKLQKLPLREGMARRRKDLTQLIGQLNGWIKELDPRIREEVARPPFSRSGFCLKLTFPLAQKTEVPSSGKRPLAHELLGRDLCRHPLEHLSNWRPVRSKAPYLHGSDF